MKTSAAIFNRAWFSSFSSSRLNRSWIPLMEQMHCRVLGYSWTLGAGWSVPWRPLGGLQTNSHAYTSPWSMVYPQKRNIHCKVRHIVTERSQLRTTAIIQWLHRETGIRWSLIQHHAFSRHPGKHTEQIHSHNQTGVEKDHILWSLKVGPNNLKKHTVLSGWICDHWGSPVLVTIAYSIQKSY